MLNVNPMKRKLTILFLLLTNLAFSQEKHWTLNDCIKHALKNNLSLASSKLELEASLSAKKHAKYKHLPTLNAYGTHGYNWGQSIDPFTNEFATDRVRSNNFYLSSTWTLFAGFEQYHITQKLKNRTVSQQYNLEVQQRNLKIDVSAQYLQILVNHYQVEIADEQIKYTKEELKRGKILVKLQEKTNYDLYQIEAQIALDSLSLTKARNELLNAQFAYEFKSLILGYYEKEE